MVLLSLIGFIKICDNLEFKSEITAETVEKL